MGEYAKRKADGEEVKIGTMDNMYYLRYEDRNAVECIHGNVNPATATGLRFRLPFPDEDDVLVGEYSSFERGLRLCMRVPSKVVYGQDSWQDFTIDNANPGSFQMTHPSGLLVNVPCHHGAKLPDLGEASVHWNGKSHSFELVFVKVMNDHTLAPIVRCRHCGEMWRVAACLPMQTKIRRWQHEPDKLRPLVC